MIVEAQAFLDGATRSRALRFGFSTLALVSALMMGCGGDSSSACKYTYSAWGACQSDGGQTHTVVSSTPSGCDGTPVLVQKCSSARDGATLYTASCSKSACHGPLATSDLKGTHPTVETYLGAHTLSDYKLTSADLELILAAIGP